MTNVGTGISWTNSTWNLAVGCDPVSAGCDHCYAEELVNRIPSFGQRFSEVRLKLDRLPHVHKFKPMPSADGPLPHLVFVNSMSDFWHDAIPEAAIHRILDVMEANPTVIFQILTKRPIRARRMLTERYGGKGIPVHIWTGVSAEDNRVRKRLDIMRTIKDRTGGGTFFVSVEPIVGPTDLLDFDGMDWIITGGESGPKARVMERAWLMDAVTNALRHDIPLYHKQSGKVASHPNIDRVPAGLTEPAKQFRWLRDYGWEILPQEKGGATIDKHTYRALAQAFETTRALLQNKQLSLVE
jgi:protein gp37